jgi:hypothetical protein
VAELVKNIHRYALGEEEVMTRDDIIRMAEECGIPEFENNESQADNILHFAAIVAAIEQEECADLCEDLADLWDDDGHPGKAAGARICASDIRARGSK